MLFETVTVQYDVKSCVHRKKLNISSRRRIGKAEPKKLYRMYKKGDRLDIKFTKITSSQSERPNVWLFDIFNNLKKHGPNKNAGRKRIFPPWGIFEKYIEIYIFWN